MFLTYMRRSLSSRKKIEGRYEIQKVFKVSCSYVTSMVSVTPHAGFFNMTVSSCWPQILVISRNRCEENTDVRSNSEQGTEMRSLNVAYFTPLNAETNSTSAAVIICFECFLLPLTFCHAEMCVISTV